MMRCWVVVCTIVLYELSGERYYFFCYIDNFSVNFHFVNFSLYGLFGTVDGVFVGDVSDDLREGRGKKRQEAGFTSNIKTKKETEVSPRSSNFMSLI